MKTRTLQHGPAVAVSFDAVIASVLTGKWDRICVPGENIKDGERTEFSAHTMTQMARNFAERGDMLMIDWNHQSSYAHANGQPAPALGFYGALAVVIGGQLVACEYAKGVAPMPPDVATMDDGLWGLRSEVTPKGQELLPGFRYVSPTFTPEGVNQQSENVGYCLLAVAATNTPWQSGTQITFDGETRAEPAREQETQQLLNTSNAAGRQGENMNFAKIAAIVGMSVNTDPKALRAAAVSKFEAEKEKAVMEDGYDFGAAAEHLEEMAKAYEDASFEEDDGDEPAHVGMRKMSARFRKMAKPEAGEPDGDESVTHESPSEEKEAMQSMARELGLPANASARQIASTMSAKTAPLSTIGKLEREVQTLKADRERDVKAERHRSAELAFEQAVRQGRTKEEKRAAFIASYERNPKDADALLFEVNTFENREVLMTRMTQGGAPIGGTTRDQSTGVLDQRVVTFSGLGNAKAVVFGENLSKAVTQMADSKDPTIAARIDAELPEGVKGTPFESSQRYLAAERIITKERPDLAAAAREDR